MFFSTQLQHFNGSRASFHHASFPSKVSSLMESACFSGSSMFLFLFLPNQTGVSHRSGCGPAERLIHAVKLTTQSPTAPVLIESGDPVNHQYLHVLSITFSRIKCENLRTDFRLLSQSSPLVTWKRLQMYFCSSAGEYFPFCKSSIYRNQLC